MPARASRKGPKKGADGKKRKRERELEDAAVPDEEAGGLFFQDSDDEGGARDDIDAVDGAGARDEETAEQKRLRLAKAFLDRLQRERALDDEGREGHEDALGDRLRRAADLESGAVFRRVADGAGRWLGGPGVCCTAGGRMLRGHRLSVTAVCLTDDDSTAYSVSKDGSIFQWDIQTLTRTRLDKHRRGGAQIQNSKGDMDGVGAVGSAPWVAAPARRAGPRGGLLACAVSSDRRYLAVGGGSHEITIYDVRTHSPAGTLRGHKDAISGLAFKHNTHDLYSTSLDRSVRIWSVGAMAYADSLFGHQQEALCVDVAPGGAERALTGGMDRTVRLFKIPEESHLVFRAPSLVTESVAFITGSQWVAGDDDGCVCVYSNTKKKAIQTVRNAHPVDATEGAGGVQQPCAGWVTAVGVARGTDLVATGAGNGVVRVWRAEGEPAKGGVTGIAPVGSFALRGFCNGLALASSGRFLLAATGQEPRMGRWARDRDARNGVWVQELGEGAGVGAGGGVEEGDSGSE